MADRVPTYRPTLDEVLAGTPLSPAEQKLLDKAKAGEVAEYDATRPEVATDANRLRAALIRFLLLGGDTTHPVHPRGVQARGAIIAGELDFASCITHLDLSLENCRFAVTPILRDAFLGALSLSGCAVPGLDLHRLRTDGDVFLRDSFASWGTVDLGGARIGGSLDCKDARLFGTELSGGEYTVIGDALNGNGIVVGADVFLSGSFFAHGQVDLAGGSIAGQLACVGGTFNGVARRDTKGVETVGDALNGRKVTVGRDALLRGNFRAIGAVNLVGAAIAGQLVCESGFFDGVTLRSADGKALERARSLHGQEMRVGSSFFWRRVQGQELQVDLTEADVGPLVDDTESWQRVAALRIGGFRYRSFVSDMTISDRLAWLDRATQQQLAWGSPPARNRVDDFDPQPYTHLAQVLRARGEQRAAARVLFARERRMARAEFHRALWAPRPVLLRLWAIFVACFFRVVAFFFRTMFGYGHFPARALIWAFCIWGVTALYAKAVFHAGQMAPAPSVILTSEDWLAAVRDGCPLPSAPDFELRRAAGCVAPLMLWTGDGNTIPPKDSAKDYETFSPGLYALDLFLPLDALGQEAAWAPSKDRGALGLWGFRLRWVVKALGWILAVVGAAVLTGLVGKRDD